MNDIEVSSIDLVEGGNVFKQGHYLTLGYVPRDEKGETVDLSGKTLNVALWGRKGVVFESIATYSGGVIRFTLDKMVPAGDYTVEFTVTSSTDAKYRKKFPTNQHSGRIAIKQSADDLGVVGIQVYTVAQLKAEQKALLDAAVSGFTVDSETKMARVSGSTTYTSLPARLEADKQATAAQLAEKVGGTTKAEPENLSERTLSLLTGEGTVNIESIPQDGSVEVQKTDFVKTGKNKFNKDDLVVGKKLSSGELVDDAAYSVSNFIPVIGDVEYVASATVSYAFYNRDKIFISQFSTGNGTPRQTPENAKYVRLSLLTTYSADLQLELGNTKTSYEPYKLTIDKLIEPVAEAQRDRMNTVESKINYVQPKVSELANRFSVGKNIFNKNSVTNGKRLSAGVIVDSADSSVSDYIPIKPNQSYIGSDTCVVTWFDKDNKYITFSSMTKTTPQVSPANAAYVRVHLMTSYVAKFQLETGTVPTLYEPFGVMLINVGVDENSLSDAVREKINNTSTKTIPEKNYNVALTGSSITWGNGLLDDSYVSIVDDYIRNQLAETLLPASIEFTGNTQTVTNLKLYKEQATKITGTGSSVKFKLAGNEMSIVQAMERSNQGASIIDMYVDGTLYDSFSNYNKEGKGHETLTINGNGSAIRFDLGRAFTYNHVVKKNGVTLTGSMNTTTTGATVSNDYLIIRKMGETENEVHHFLWMATAPAASDTVTIDFDYGESIMYAKTTVGEIGESIASSLESRFGDGAATFDPAEPTSTSAGLDFRKTDKRAVKTWKFTENAERSFEFRIRGLDSRATGTPYFIINFVTNRMHYIKNAGIGGWSAKKLLENQQLIGIDDLMEDIPDVVFFESGTNDDWDYGKFAATRSVTMTEDELRRTPTIWLKSTQYVSTNNYTVETSLLEVESATPRSVKVKGTGATFDGIKQGDILLVGNYHYDNREVQSRIIESWDSVRNVATFKKPLIIDGSFGVEALTDLSGREVRIKRIDGFTESYKACIEEFKNHNPAVKIGLVDTGLANFASRLLIGYPEKFEEIAVSGGYEHVDLYDYISEWQYSQKRDLTAYLKTANNKVADGSTVYKLVNASGVGIFENTSGKRNFSVKVNGIERYGDECHIDGTRGYYFKDSLSASQLNFANWDSRNSSKIDLKVIETRLVFTERVPAAGDIVSVTYSDNKWSNDDCHLGGGQPGATLFGHRVFGSLKKLIGEV